MEAMEYWKIFMETGAPELYLLYSDARRREEACVSDRSSGGPESYRLQ